MVVGKSAEYPLNQDMARVCEYSDLSPRDQSGWPWPALRLVSVLCEFIVILYRPIIRPNMMTLVVQTGKGSKYSWQELGINRTNEQGAADRHLDEAEDGLSACVRLRG